MEDESEADFAFERKASAVPLRNRAVSILPYYFHQRRMEHVGGMRISTTYGQDPDGEFEASLRRSRLIDQNIRHYLTSCEIPSLHELIATDSLSVGAQFTLDQSLTFNNPPAKKRVRGVRIPFRTTVVQGEGKWKVQGELDTTHYTSASSWAELERRSRHLLLAYVRNIEADLITCAPILVGHYISQLKTDDGERFWPKNQEVAPESIAEFARLATVAPPTPAELKVMKSIPEKAVKEALQEIIRHPFEHNDWGGEQEDVFARLTVMGSRRFAAFLLKGPGVGFRPMTPAMLGKNGDQAVRLFSRSTEIVVLQHCHRVTPEVRETLIAFASRPGRERLFAILDGSDTYRLLRAHGKCGLSVP